MIENVQIATRAADVTKLRPPQDSDKQTGVFFIFLCSLSVKMACLSSTCWKPLTILTENDRVPGSKFDREPEHYTVEQLKRWLKCRGMKLSGKRDELVTQVSDCIKKGSHRVLDVSIDQGKWFAAKVIKDNQEVIVDKSIKSKLSFVPTVPVSGWRTFQSQDIPVLFNYGHIYYYALESIKTVVTESGHQDDEDEEGLGHMTAKPLKNGRKYVDSGFVHDMMDTKTEEHYFLKAHVWPSMRNELPNNVLIILSVSSGAVIHASCDPCKVSALGRCSHVVAVLFSLLDHVNEQRPTISTSCTSKECSWNKGKKRDKNPERLSEVKYPSKRKLSSTHVIDFDPRPKSFRRVTSSHINGLLRDLQSISQKCNEISMWETQLEIKYEDYQLEDVNLDHLMNNTAAILQSLTPSKLKQIEGTDLQSANERWYCERWCRLTASQCLSACRIGRLVLDGDPNADVRAFKFISSHIWGINREPFQSYWMRYGLESEPKAILKYEEQSNTVVCKSGLWVNPNYPFLGCSPDGIVGEDGLLEIKSLKIFKHSTIESVVEKWSTLPKVVKQGQCFITEDGQCILKSSHDYYYQIQMQLLVTERIFCDFVLYAENGPVSIERIYQNEHVINEIIKCLTALWKRVVAPELYEMRVPRNLLPFILPENINKLFLSTYAHNNVEMDIKSDTSIPSNSNDEMDIKSVTDTSSHTNDEMEVADCLINTLNMIQTDSKLINAGIVQNVPVVDTLVIFPWGGVTSESITLHNTCPIDNWLMIFQVLVKSKRLDLSTLPETGQIIQNALNLIDSHHYADAKLAILPSKPTVISNIINLYGGESDFFIKHLNPYLKSTVRTTCNLNSCPKPFQSFDSSVIILGRPSLHNAQAQDWRTIYLSRQLMIGCLQVSHSVKGSLRISPQIQFHSQRRLASMKTGKNHRFRGSAQG